MSKIHLILLSTFTFTAIVFVLVSIILVAKSKFILGFILDGDFLSYTKPESDPCCMHIL